MATSPIYGWLEPDNTDLVKNGALAIRTLGNAIDTTMATMTPKSLVDAKGDLVTATANDTPARLAVGADGSTLVANSAASTGLSWAGQPYANPVLNSAFQVWQRGTSFAIPSSVNTYTADRWAAFRGATGTTVSRQTVSDTTNLPFIQYAARLQRDSGNTSVVAPYLAQAFETINSIPYAGKTVTISFYARRGANFSAANNYLSLQVLTGTGTDQTWLGYTGTAFVLNQGDILLTTTMQRFSYTFAIGSTATEFSLVFSYTPVGTAGTNDWFEVTGVQIDLGSVALPFKTYAGTIQGELAACQRYYFRQGGDIVYQRYGNGSARSTNQVDIVSKLAQTMRVTPTAVDYSNLAVYDGSTITAVTSVSLDQTAPSIAALLITVASGLTQFRPYGLMANNTTSSFLGFSAEL